MARLLHLIKWCSCPLSLVQFLSNRLAPPSRPLPSSGPSLFFTILTGPMEGHMAYLQKPWGIRKALWLFLLGGGICLATRDIYFAIVRYTSKPINTFTTLRYPGTLSFPQIIICNSNQFRITEAEKDLYQLITSAYENMENVSQFRIENHSKDIERAIENTGHKEAFAYRLRTAHKLKDMVLKCTTWTGENCNDKFVEKIYDYGICYNLNGSNWPRVTQAGSTQSLNIFVNLESYQHMQGPANYLTSLKVAVLHREAYPLISMTARGFEIPPGYMSIVSLKYNKYNRVLSKDGGSCTEKRELEHFDPEHYSYETCQLNLALVETMKHCGCKPYLATGKPFAALSNSFQCNQTCESTEYTIGLSGSKISPSIWPSLITPEKSARIYDTFNRSMESWSRNDRNRVQRLRTLTDNVRTAADDLRRFDLEPPNGTSLIKEAKRAFEKSKAPECYWNILRTYGSILDEFENKGLGWVEGKNCLSASAIKRQPIAPREYPSDEMIKSNIQRLIEGRNGFWQAMGMEHFCEWPVDLNRSLHVFKDQAQNVHRFIKELVTIYKVPWCLSKPVALTSYWKLFDQMNSYYDRRTKLKEWVDEHPNNVGMEYQNNYASEFISTYQLAQTRLERLFDVIENVTQITSRPFFWSYFGVYLFFRERIFNETLCKADNGSNDSLHLLQTCQSNPFLNLKTFFADAFSCAQGDFVQSLDTMKDNVSSIAENYRWSVEDLEDFLMSYGRKWEFGEEFFSNNIAGLKIYFADLSQQWLVEEMAYNINILFGDIGGSLGLFIGASVLSLFECIDILLWDVEIFKKFRKILSNEKDDSNNPNLEMSQSKKYEGSV